MYVDIVISKSDLLKEIARLTAYIGANSADGNGDSLYDKVSVTDYDNELLETFMRKSLDSVVGVVREFLASCSFGDTIRIKLDMPNNSIGDLSASIKNNIFTALVNGAIADWMKTVNATNFEPYAETFTNSLSEINTKIYARKAPNRIIPTL